MEYKTVPFDMTKLDAEGRTIEGYAAVFGNRDLGGDVIHPGAFTKTLTERGGKVKFLWQHDSRHPLGPPMEMREDAKGLFVRAKVSETTWGNDALALARDGALDGMSIGYDAIPASTDYTKDATGEPTRNLRELKLWEFSLVTFPMNEGAGVTAVKEQDPAGDAEKDAEPDDAKEQSMESRIGEVERAFRAQFNGGGMNGPDYWVRDTFADAVVVSVYREQPNGAGAEDYPNYRVPMSRDETGNITFAPQDQWIGGAYTFVAGQKENVIAPADGQAALADSDEQKATDANGEAGPDDPPTSELVAELAALEVNLLLLESED